MKGKARINKIYLAAIIVTSVTLACNLSNPQGSVEPTPEVTTVVITATLAAPVEGTPATPSSSSPESGTPESSGGSGSGGGVTTTSPEGDIFTSVSVKNGNASFEGNIVFPGSDASDNIYVKPVDFDSTKTEGKLVFTLNCSGRGKAKVNYKGGAVRVGIPGCGETWTVSVIDGSPDSQITLHLDATGDVDWTLTVTSSE